MSEINTLGVLQFYEYGVDNYPSPTQAVRYEPAPLGLQPAHEIISLSDYRHRHALYRMDRGLQVRALTQLLARVMHVYECVEKHCNFVKSICNVGVNTTSPVFPSDECDKPSVPFWGTRTDKGSLLRQR